MPAPADQPPSPGSPPDDRYCDLVMNGGITSGVVFPKAVAELATRYRFHAIAGTSAGAMAAALAAAAEYTRRRTRSEAVFVKFGKVASEFGDEMPRGNTRLFSLFQPERSTRRLFQVLLGALEKDSPADRLRGVLAALQHQYRGPARANTALAAGLLLLAGWHRAEPIAATLVDVAVLAHAGAAAALAFVATPWFEALHDLREGLVPNGFGLCTGMRPDINNVPHEPDDPQRPLALVEWLHGSIQQLAGRGPDEPALSFADLHAAPGFPPPWLPPPGTQPARSIDLRMVTTNLSHGLPCNLPLDESAPPLYFDAIEWRRYFPAAVVQQLCEAASAVLPHQVSVHAAPVQLFALPSAQMPIVVAARLSLSFPLLFSAVPLWALDTTQPDTPQLARCWFSDGGISSNFPIHLFDSAVPKWPTFGIALRSLDPLDPLQDDLHRVRLSGLHGDGAHHRWNRAIDDPSASALGRLAGFLGAAVVTAKDWHDNATSRLPGVRDRVVNVALKDGQEGGLNLLMPKERIGNLVDWGQRAGQALLGKFSPVNGRTAPAWDEHRWVRLNTYLHALRRSLDGLGTSLAQAPHNLPVAEQVVEALLNPPLAGTDESTLSAEQARALQHLQAALQQVEQAFAATAAVPAPYQPWPEPQMRVVPPN